MQTPSSGQAASVARDVVVHLRTPLLAVVHDVEAGAFEKRERVPRGPVVDRGELLPTEAAAAEQLEKHISSSGRPAKLLTRHAGFPSEPISLVKNLTVMQPLEPEPSLCLAP